MDVKITNNYVSPKEAAQILGYVSQQSVVQLRDRNILHPIRCGCHDYYDLQEIHDLRKSREWKNETMPNPFKAITFDFDDEWRFLSPQNNYTTSPTDYMSSTPYAISRRGKIVNLRSMRELVPARATHGYMQVSIYGNKAQRLHRLVALVWCDNDKGKTEVHHIDGDINNNHSDNLIWVTPEEHDEAHALIKGAKIKNDFSGYDAYIKQLRQDNKWTKRVHLICEADYNAQYGNDAVNYDNDCWYCFYYISDDGEIMSQIIVPKDEDD